MVISQIIFCLSVRIKIIMEFSQSWTFFYLAETESHFVPYSILKNLRLLHLLGVNMVYVFLLVIVCYVPVFLLFCSLSVSQICLSFISSGIWV